MSVNSEENSEEFWQELYKNEPNNLIITSNLLQEAVDNGFIINKNYGYHIDSIIGKSKEATTLLYFAQCGDEDVTRFLFQLGADTLIKTVLEQKHPDGSSIYVSPFESLFLTKPPLTNLTEMIKIFPEGDRVFNFDHLGEFLPDFTIKEIKEIIGNLESSEPGFLDSERYVTFDLPLNELLNSLHKKGTDISDEVMFINNGQRSNKDGKIDEKLMKGITVEETAIIVGEAVRLQKENGYHPSYPLNYLIEFHSYTLDHVEKEPYEPVFGWHVDSGSAISYDVNTTIFYLEKSEGIKGGNFMVFKEREDRYDKKELKDHFDIVDTAPKDNMMKVLILRGDVYHAVEEMYGNGVRRSIVVQIFTEAFQDPDEFI
jgi:hypothetical protein